MAETEKWVLKQMAISKLKKTVRVLVEVCGPFMTLKCPDGRYLLYVVATGESMGWYSDKETAQAAAGEFAALPTNWNSVRQSNLTSPVRKSSRVIFEKYGGELDCDFHTGGTVRINEVAA